MSVAIEKDISVLKINIRYNFKVLDLAIQYLTVLKTLKINQEQEAQNLKQTDENIRSAQGPKSRTGSSDAMRT
jgi:hypothetical protein